MENKTLLEMCDDVLIAEMRPGLKQAIDICLAKGENPYRILDFVRRKTGGRKSTVFLQVWAYLEKVLGGSPIDPDNRPPR